MTFLEKQKVGLADTLIRLGEAKALLSVARAQLSQDCFSIHSTHSCRQSIRNAIDDTNYAIEQVALLKNLADVDSAASVGLDSPTTVLAGSTVKQTESAKTNA